jgi:hypothetical protein
MAAIIINTTSLSTTKEVFCFCVKVEQFHSSIIQNNPHIYFSIPYFYLPESHFLL